MNKRTKGESLFPMWLFFVYLGVLLLMSGIHSGLVVGAQRWGWGGLMRTLAPILYWSAVAGGLTVFTRYRIRITYEEPMLRMADATRKVAKGDFSVYFKRYSTVFSNLPLFLSLSTMSSKALSFSISLSVMQWVFVTS